MSRYPMLKNQVGTENNNILVDLRYWERMWFKCHLSVRRGLTFMHRDTQQSSVSEYNQIMFFSDFVGIVVSDCGFRKFLS